MSIASIHADNIHFKAFRAAMKIYGARSPNPAIASIKKIVAVGAFYDPDKGLRGRDQFWLGHSLNFCGTANVEVDRNFEYTPVNLAYGDDFLDPALSLSADLLIFCYVTHPEAYASEKDSPDYAILEKARKTEPELFISPFHAENAWREAAVRSGSRLVIAFNKTRNEIGSADLKSEAYIEGEKFAVPVPLETGLTQRYRMEILPRADIAPHLMRLRA